MNIQNIPIAGLKPAAYNPRKISRQTLKTLKANIKEFGLVDPLIVNKDMTIIGGHQRFKACLEMGFEEMPCMVLDLSKSKEKALNLALNKVTGDWDKKKLEKLLHDIDSLDLDDIAPRLMEEYNYIVIFFPNTLDFQVAADHFGLKMQKEDKREKIGLGRVVDGVAYLRSIGK